MNLFEPDIFSVETPVWTATSSPKSKLVRKVLQRFALPECAMVHNIEKSGALEVNSSNFRITTSEGQYLLKRWGGKQSEDEIKRILGLLHWLQESQQIPVSPALISGGQPVVLLHKDSLWSIFRFVTGQYYNGQSDQLEAAADMVARLHMVLAITPRPWLPAAGPLHGTERDKMTLQHAAVKRDEWETIFDPESALLLGKNWNFVETAWEQVIQTDLNAGCIQPVHFDLHPHNILMSGRNVSAVLDFDSCKQMQVGYALAFAGLKLCRQAVAGAGGALMPAMAGRRFLKILCEREPRFEVFADQFAALAVSEVLRRICIILWLNFENSEQTWNHVLPIQIRHIGEAQALFGDL